MAIYKLDELVCAVRGNSSFQKKDLNNNKLDNSYVALHYGKTYKVDAVDENYSYYANSNFYKENQIVNRLDTILVSTSETLEDLGHSYIYLRQDPGLLGGEQILLKANINLILPEYLYYLTKHLKQQFRKYATGMKVYRFKIDDFKYIIADIPSIDKQQEIIDIIRPIEKLYLKYPNTVRIDNVENCKSDVKNLIDIIKPIEKSISTLNDIQQNIEKLENSLIHASSITNLKFSYQKGGLAGDEGTTTFLNVASANGNPNRFVNNEPNVFIGDITLSLDGNCGLVNNCLEGYNGYLYKVTASNIPNWQVFYSLKTNHSQNIIKLNENGTTIKHASGAKKELVVHDFKNKKLLESLFTTRIQVFKMKSDLEKKLQNTIKLLIK